METIVFDSQGTRCEGWVGRAATTEALATEAGRRAS